MFCQNVASIIKKLRFASSAHIRKGKKKEGEVRGRMLRGVRVDESVSGKI